MLDLKRVTVLAGWALLAFACGKEFTAGEAVGGAGGQAGGEGGNDTFAAATSGVGGDGVPDGGDDAGGRAPLGGASGGGSPNGGRGGISSLGGGGSGGKGNDGGSLVGGSGGSLVGGSGGSGGSGGTVVVVPPVPLNGLELWFDAKEGVTETNGAVSTWKDRSGHQRDALQTALNYRPKLDPSGLKGKPALVFAGDDYLKLPTLPGDFSKGVSIFAVGQDQSEAGVCSAIFEASNGSEIDDVHLGFYQNAVLYEVANNWYAAADHPLILGEPQLLAAIHQTSNALQIRRNSNGLGESNFALPVTIERQFVYIGRTEYGDCKLYHGMLSELLVYNRAVSDAELIDIESYLQKKWDCCSE